MSITQQYNQHAIRAYECLQYEIVTHRGTKPRVYALQFYKVAGNNIHPNRSNLYILRILFLCSFSLLFLIVLHELSFSDAYLQLLAVHLFYLHLILLELKATCHFE